jgi:ribonucleoside-diphosphate reductase alpha chain
VQHLDFLSAHQKRVFATAIEIDQMEIVEQAADRQKFICQGQSLNLFFPAGESRGLLHKVHFAAWKLGCKGLYYLRTESSNRAENVSKKVERNKLVDISEVQVQEQTQEECVACQG